ncbi:MAG: hypothetical protein SNJ70_06100 [Armatimonadota bacterium]
MFSFLQISIFLLSIAFIVILFIHTIKHAQSLSKKIDEYHKEQDDKKNKPGPINPYDDMASIYNGNQSNINKMDLN